MGFLAFLRPLSITEDMSYEIIEFSRCNMRHCTLLKEF